MPKPRYTRDKQCERCGELDDGRCACTEVVVHPPPQPAPFMRAERRSFFFNPRESETWPWEV